MDLKHSVLKGLHSNHNRRNFKSVNNRTYIQCYTRKKYLGGKAAGHILFYGWLVTESFQIIWVIGVRPNLITWVVGVSLRGRGRKNIICQKKREVFI